MEKVKIHFNEEGFTNKLNLLGLKVSPLQQLHDLIKSLGGENIKLSDILTVMESDGNSIEVKKIVFKGKDLTIAGFKLDPSVIPLDPGTLLGISRIARNAQSITGSEECYELQNGKVKISESYKETLKEGFTLYGSERTKEIIEKAEQICKQLDELCKAAGAKSDEVYHPLRNPEGWIIRNTAGFAPNIFHIANHVK